MNVNVNVDVHVHENKVITSGLIKALAMPVVMNFSVDRSRLDIMLIGVDTGGTFTDFVMIRDGHVHTYKVPSTPGDFAQGVLEGVRSLLSGAAASRTHPFNLIHSSTVATNALLERKGARTALITTRGFRDVLEIGRQARPELYNLFVDRSEPLVPQNLRHEVDERLSAEGKVLIPFDEEQAGRVLDSLDGQNVESVAVCLLFSFMRPQHERSLVRAARKRGFDVSASSEILPEFREYERTSTTVANAYVSPAVSSYLQRLGRSAKRLGARHLRIMQSNGGSLSVRAASERAVSTLLSGPAAGVIGALSVARQALGPGNGPGRGEVKIITFDMGGTSTDVSLVNGEYSVTNEGSIGGHPVRVPMIDIHTVGAGGGSLASVDAGGALHVGPQSAGAHPGPACYGTSEDAAVTDANLLLGFISPEYFLGGRMTLDRERAENALQRLADRLGTNAVRAARAVIRIVNSNMERAIRVISVERGFDPREFTLVSFGGAGGLHACHLAEALDIPRVLIPRNPGVLSAWGALAADVVKDYSRTVMLPLRAAAEKKLSNAFSQLERQAQTDLQREGFQKGKGMLFRSLDIRYAGQSYELTVPFNGRLDSAAKGFHRAHARRYGHSAPAELVEIVTARVRAVGRSEKPALGPVAGGRKDGRKAIIKKHGSLVLYGRDQLLAGNVLTGPALIIEDFATTLIPGGWQGKVDKWGNLLLQQ